MAITNTRHAIEPIIKPTIVLDVLTLSEKNFVQMVPLSLQDTGMLNWKRSNDCQIVHLVLSVENNSMIITC